MQSQFKWTHASTLLLIEEHRLKAELFASSAMRKTEVWGLVAKALRAKGHEVTGYDCDKKWRNLKGTYKSTREKMNKTGAGRITWEYYDTMDDQLFHDPSIIPSKTIGSIGGVTIIKKQRPRAFRPPATEVSGVGDEQECGDGEDSSDSITNPQPGPSGNSEHPPPQKRKLSGGGGRRKVAKEDEIPEWLKAHLDSQKELLEGIKKTMDTRNDLLKAFFGWNKQIMVFFMPSKSLVP